MDKTTEQEVHQVRKLGATFRLFLKFHTLIEEQMSYKLRCKKAKARGLPVPKVPAQSLTNYNMALQLIDEIPPPKAMLAEALSMDRFPRTLVMKIVLKLEVLYSNGLSADTTKVKDAFARLAGKDSPEWVERVKFGW